jgi:hypothetical protein
MNDLKVQKLKSFLTEVKSESQLLTEQNTQS